MKRFFANRYTITLGILGAEVNASRNTHGSTSSSTVEMSGWVYRP